MPATNPNFLAELQLLLVTGGIRIVEAVIILVAGWTLATWAKRWLASGLEHLPIDLTLKPLLAQLARYGVLILTLILVLGQFGVQTTSLIAVMGAAGLAIGLAMQGTLSNVAAGMMLLILRPFRVGQFVEVGGQQGTVREIGLFTTILMTRDLVYVSMPNAQVFGAVIVNYTREPRRRVSFNVPVDAVNDIDKVEKIILEALSANKLVMKGPEPRAGISTLQEYAVVMYAQAYVESKNYWIALPALQKDVKIALDKANILLAVTRQASVVRNEPRTPFTTPPAQTAPTTPQQTPPEKAPGA